MKVLELFSGIGGMHYSLQAAEIHADVTAVEINTTANEVYRHNFPSSNLLQKNLVAIRSEEINSKPPELLIMSPPCQPFTRVGLKKDLDDVRTDPLKHVLELLHELPSLNYILVENVKGFEDSEARNVLVRCLEGLHFSIREHLISPSQLGVPNTRTRYYLLAKRRPLQFSYESCTVLEELPKEYLTILNQLQSQFPEIRSIEDILEIKDIASETFQNNLIPDPLLVTRIRVMDIVTPCDTRSCCFTKAYGHYAKGAGSVLCPYDHITIEQVLKKHTHDSLDFSAVKALNLRYFTPREVARLMCFPECFTFPGYMTRKQKYRLLGNSVNIKVVAMLLKLLLS